MADIRIQTADGRYLYVYIDAHTNTGLRYQIPGGRLRGVRGKD